MRAQMTWADLPDDKEDGKDDDPSKTLRMPILQDKTGEDATDGAAGGCPALRHCTMN